MSDEADIDAGSFKDGDSSSMDESYPASPNDNDGSEDQDMMSTFASVFVKVEVDSDDQLEIKHNSPESSQSPEEKRVHKPGRGGPMMSCSLCAYKTSFKHCMEIHVRIHEGQPELYMCNICHYTSKSLTTLKRHKTIHNNKGKGIYECDKCNYKTDFKYNLKTHKGKHTEKKNYKCRHCDFETSYKQSFAKHNKVQHAGMTYFKCDKCPFQTKYEGHITRHLALLHNEVFETAFKCDHCDFRTKYNWRLTIHSRRMTREQPIKCMFNACDFETSYNCAYKKHKSTHWNNCYRPPKHIMRVGTAEEAVALLKTQEPLITQNVQPIMNKQQLHTKTLEDTKSNSNFTTSDINCPKPFDNFKQNVINNHSISKNYVKEPHGVDWHNIDVIESDDRIKPFKCSQCAYTAKFKASVQRHYQRQHTGNAKTYKCTNCDFSTKTKDQISLHNKRSQSELPVICNVCNFSTFFKCTSVMHQKTHYENKCSMCPYICKHKHELQRHIETFHLGRGTKCRFCDYKSHRKESVLCHETIHTGQKPFKCPECEYSSVRRSLLDKHYKRFHCSENPDNKVVIDQDKIQSLKITLSSKNSLLNEQPKAEIENNY